MENTNENGVKLIFNEKRCPERTIAWTKSWGEGEKLIDPHCFCVGEDESVYVVDKYFHWILRFCNNGNILHSWDVNPGIASIAVGHCQATYEKVMTALHSAANLSEWPPGLTAICTEYVGSERLYAVNTPNCFVVSYETDGTLIRTWGKYGSECGQFKRPRGCAVGPGGRVYVSDTINWSVQVFDHDGHFLHVIRTIGAPEAVCVDRHGNVYVLRYHRRNSKDFIQRYHSSGTLDTKWISNTPLRIHSPTSVAVDDKKEGIVYVSDNNTNSIYKYGPGGIKMEDINGYVSPWRMTIGPNRLVYIIDHDKPRILAAPL